MGKVFSVNGHFNDDPDEVFCNYLVTEYDNTPDGYADEQIFFYGIHEDDLIGVHDDFTITSYEVVSN